MPVAARNLDAIRFDALLRACRAGVSWASLARAWISGSGQRDNDDAGSLAGIKDLAGRTSHGVCSRS